MTGELWWCRLVNSARFLDDLKDTLSDDRSVLLLFDKSFFFGVIYTYPPSTYPIT